MELKPLEEIAFINPDSIKKDYPYDEIEYIDIQSVGSGYLIESKLIPLSEAPSRAKRLIKDGDTILSTVRPNRRSFLYIKKPKGNIVVSTGFAVLRAKDGIDSRYFYYTVTDQKFTDYLTLSAKGAAYPAVDTEIIQRGRIPVYLIDVQQKISSILSAYDNLIENNTRRIQILEEMAQRIYREWFVDFRFPGHEKTKFIDSEMGKILEGWRIEQLDKYIDFERGVEPGSDNYEKHPNEENVSFLRVRDLGDRSIEIFVNRTLTKNKIIREDDIAVSMDGTPGIVKMGLSGCYSTGIRKLVIKDNTMKKSFLYFLMTSEHIQNIIKAHSKGTTILHASESIKHMNFVLPTNNIMRIFDDMVSPMIKEILSFNKKNKILRETRDLLLPKLISGELDVSGLDIAVREEKI
ncbi:MAG: restriction endonuclease subunit S [bacterium]|nr:restriction endonuclease subunit S [bacterium]